MNVPFFIFTLIVSWANDPLVNVMHKTTGKKKREKFLMSDIALD
jgi:hypothetical protein